MRTSKELYHVFADGSLGGSIDRILDVGPGKLRLQVAPKGVREPPEKLKIWQMEWQHHRFTLWELLLSQRLLMPYNGQSAFTHSTLPHPIPSHHIPSHPITSNHIQSHHITSKHIPSHRRD